MEEEEGNGPSVAIPMLKSSSFLSNYHHLLIVILTLFYIYTPLLDLQGMKG